MDKIEIITASKYYKRLFKQKVYKLSLNAGCTCPNRDSTLDTRGCIFCSDGGSGEFAASSYKSITEQIEEAKNKVKDKLDKKSLSSPKYIAYFQAFTNTYGNVDILRAKYLEAISHPEIVALSIATRPDSISNEMLDILSDINKTFPVFIELGLQTIHENTAKYIRRGYGLDVYEDCVRRLEDCNINVVTHLIIGLPNETEDDMLRSVKYVGGISKKYNHVTHGIKLQLLHVLKGTDLEKDYNKGLFNVLSMDEYIDIIYKALQILPKDIVIHRLTGDGDKKLLVEPMWSANKKLVLSEINKLMNPIILASSSPRRKEILEKRHIPFVIRTANVDESSTLTDPKKLVKELSYRKAIAVSAKYPDNIVLGADTVVSIDGTILGKPQDETDAYNMISSLQGRCHEVYTGVTIIGPDKEVTFAEKTDVYVSTMTPSEIKDYIKTGEGGDKAGSYAIQGIFQKYIKSYDKDYENVVGLPGERVESELKKFELT